MVNMMVPSFISDKSDCKPQTPASKLNGVPVFTGVIELREA
jgi:hypothetical protein